TFSPQTIERPLLLPLWPARQPPLRRPSRDNNVCIFGPSRNDRAGCVPVAHWSEQSLKRVYPTRALERRQATFVAQPRLPKPQRRPATGGARQQRVEAKLRGAPERSWQ